VSAGARTVVVSGGTGALGRAVVDAFLGVGDRVVAPWIVAAERDALAGARAGAVSAGRLVLPEADVAEEAGADAVARAAGAAEVLVNGVGGFAGGTNVHETPLEVWDHMYRMNLRSAAALCRAILPGMLARSHGVVVNLASQAALTRPAGLAAYAAAKDGVLVLTDSLHREASPAGIRVHAVLPSTIDTPANRRAMPGADFSQWTPPAAIARVIVWLASDAAACVRGAHVPV
jgi:NAD(P)-dependent dehydrogenase (short-subunit alcohol dehydrogenase family)